MGFFGLGSVKSSGINWQQITGNVRVEDLIEASNDRPVLLFKHSTRCSISAMALHRFEHEWDLDNEKCSIYLLDLLNFRGFSNKTAELTGIRHESPQVIVWSKGEVIYHDSHSGISAKSIKKLIE
jgi:bacillithiol system protein YtxJ